MTTKGALARHLVFIGLMLVAVEDAIGQPSHSNGIVEGIVRDRETRMPIIGVTVVCYPKGPAAVSDSLGFYRIKGVPQELTSLQFSCIGYKRLTVRDISLAQGGRTRVDIALEIQAIEVAGVEIVQEVPFFSTREAATSFSIDASRIDKIPVARLEEFVTLQPGVTYEGNVRGGKTDEVTYVVDGVAIHNLVSGGSEINLPRSAVSLLQIHTGGYQSELGNAMSGIVQIQSKSPNLDEFGSEFRFASDQWIPSKYNKQQDRRSELEFCLTGPLVSGSVGFLTSNQVILTDTRWWQDYRHFFSSPVEKEFSGLTKAVVQQDSENPFTLQAMYTVHSWRDYEYSWRYNLSGLPQRTTKFLQLSLAHQKRIAEDITIDAVVSRTYGRNSIGREGEKPISVSSYEYDPYLQFVISGGRNWWSLTNQARTTVQVNASILHRTHDLKMGMEINFFEIHSELIKYEPQVTYFGKPIVDAPLLSYSSGYSYSPRTGSLFVQGKWDVSSDGSVLTAGIRWDFLDPRAQRPIVEFIPVRSNEYRDTLLSYSRASFKHQISPRLTFAMPLGGYSFFFVNFGHYFQFPLFDYLYSGQDPSMIKRGVKNIQSGNTDLQPERTSSWEAGFKKQLSRGMMYSLTYFRKRITNQIDSKTLIPYDSKAAGDYGFTSYVNNAEAYSEGAELLLTTPNVAGIRATLSYTYMIAEGLSSSADDGLNLAQWGFIPQRKLFPLSWDQRHSIKANIEKDLPLGIQSEWIIFYNSPKPYTYYPTRDGTSFPSSTLFSPNNARMSDFFLINARLSKTFACNAFGGMVVLHASIRNLLNRRNVKWMDSAGNIGGELHDPSGYYEPRRVLLGLTYSL